MGACRVIKIFILTYNAPDDLAKNLKSLFSSQASKDRYQVNIINNHSNNFYLDTVYNTQVKIHHQTLRANWGCGTPARDWNQALVLGFGNLKTPDCEQIILCQDDAIWEPNWLESLDNIHQTYDFYQCSWGDCFISVLPSAIKKIGLFDERMCTLGYYEGDFLLRAWLYNRETSSINDYHHGRVWNETVTVANRATDERSTPRYMNHSGKIFSMKWPGIDAQRWRKSLFKNPPTGSAIDNYIYYPYFEYDIQDLLAKRYILP